QPTKRRSLPTRPTRPVVLAPHPQSCSLEHLQEYVKTLGDAPLAIDLFCGAGGLSLGLEEAGFQTILGVDCNEEAIRTHRAYFAGASVCLDLSDPSALRDIASALCGMEIALVAGGPPCQPFSRAGQSKIRSLIRQGVWDSDERRELWQAFVEIVEEVCP